MNTEDEDEEYCVKRRKKGEREETLHSSRLSKKEAIRTAHVLNSSIHGENNVYSVEKGKVYDFIDGAIDSTKITTKTTKSDRLVWVPGGTQGFDW